MGEERRDGCQGSNSKHIKAKWGVCGGRLMVEEVKLATEGGEIG